VRLFSLDESQRLPISLEQAWSFFSDPRNLAEITPSSLGLRITSEPGKKMYAGMIITYIVTPVFGIPMRWITEITHVDEPNLFIDDQRFGPYRFWHHQHHFTEIEGGIEIRDLVHYSPFFSPFDVVINELVAKKKLKEIFSFRRKYLEKRFGSM
jgi:ligand-binding SRPBCC domain-containing protein